MSQRLGPREFTPYGGGRWLAGARSMVNLGIDAEGLEIVELAPLAGADPGDHRLDLGAELCRAGSELRERRAWPRRQLDASGWRGGGDVPARTRCWLGQRHVATGLPQRDSLVVHGAGVPAALSRRAYHGWACSGRERPSRTGNSADVRTFGSRPSARRTERSCRGSRCAVAGRRNASCQVSRHVAPAVDVILDPARLMFRLSSGRL